MEDVMLWSIGTEFRQLWHQNCVVLEVACDLHDWTLL